jgi:DNA relaxase NicK
MRDGHWVRVEVEFHAERAQAAALALTECDGVAKIAGVVRSYLDFKEASGDGNTSRWETSAFWLDFLGRAAKCRLDVAGVARTLATVVRWLDRQVMPSIALWFASASGDVGELVRWIDRGRARWKPEHMAMLAAAS